MSDLKKIWEDYEAGANLTRDEVGVLFEEIVRLNEDITELEQDFFATFREMVKRGRRLEGFGEDMGL